MNIQYAAFAALLISLDCYADLPAPAPIQKNGSCPSGYGSQGDFCAPHSGARFAISKNGSCPSSYGSQGNYCVANSSARLAIPKGSGSCPSGYGSQGNYCVSSK